MAQMHGKDVRVYFQYDDVSDHLGNVDVTGAAAVHDTTVFAGGGWRSSAGGILSWEGTLEGLYNNVALVNGEFPSQLEGMLGANPSTLQGALMSIFDGAADAVGRGLLLSPAIVSRLARPFTIADMVRQSVRLTGAGRVGWNAVLLHPLGNEAATGNGASVDNGAATAAGGRINVHALLLAGSWTIKVQHSTDNAAWADLATFGPYVDTGLAVTTEVAGTVNRYLRATWTENVAGTANGLVVGFARH